MKRFTQLTFFIFLLSLGLTYAQTSTETRRLDNFNAVKVSTSIKAELVQGNENKIEIKATGIDLDKIESSISDKTLEVKLGRGNFRNHSVNVVITYRDIQGIEATTSASVVAKDAIEAAEAYLFAATSGYIEADVTSEVLRIEAATNARIVVNGEADELRIKAYTNAEVDGKNFDASDVDVLANTAASVYFNSTGSIVGSAATAGKIYYGGNPKSMEVKTSTGGSIQKK
ncbi:head GIN domain-containing protein [Mongoliibacter ruber]|uniref:Putative autotransporter adhesin-like protein n=1 Tax=Mongoliibacter ruber TaxID=1750599 RepID=A0A2T0WHK8_9BACT|nr:head GIN domain-containing protein [Mongoliibacter ruber]PRY86189.1 putative autotransporter adhesin-like protein [Mongoliibacter ruber]